MITIISRTIIFGTLLFACVASPAFAEKITLKSLDGTFSLEGDLIGFDGQQYTLKSVFGEVAVNVIDANCIGSGCPDLSLYSSKFAIAVSDIYGRNLVPNLITAFAENSSLRVDVIEVGKTQEYALQDSAGETAATIVVHDVSSDEVYSLIENGMAVFAVSTRTPSSSEVAQIKSVGYGDLSAPVQQSILAMDGLVVVVSKDNPVNLLSITEIGKIFSGEITNWSEVGGADAAIHVYRRNGSVNGSDLFHRKVMTLFGKDFTSSASIISKNSVFWDVIDSDPNGIGITYLSDRGEAKALPVADNCGIRFVPTDFAIKTEEYPLSERLVVYVADREVPEVANQFLKFVASGANRDSVRRSGFVDLGIENQSIDNQGIRYANSILLLEDDSGVESLKLMARELMNAERLSTTFRFNAGSSTFDARAVGDIERLLDLFSSNDFSGKEILLVGFSGSVGKTGVNLALSAQRAKLVLNALMTADSSGTAEELDFKVIGLGEISPMACNDAPRGRHINRRVEVWVRDNK